MASCAAGKVFRVYDQKCITSWLEHGDTSLWQVKGRTQKIHVNPQNFHNPLGVLCNIPLRKYAFVYPLIVYSPFIWSPHVIQ